MKTLNYYMSMSYRMEVVEDKTEDLLINYICVLSVYPILTFLYLLFTLYVVSYMVSINFSMLNLKRFPYSPKEKYAKYKFKNTVFCA